MLRDQEGNQNECASSESDSSEPKGEVNIQHKETNAIPKYKPRFSQIFRQDKMQILCKNQQF